MAVPTITTITPNPVFTGGRSLIEIHGTNFRVAPLPAPGPWGPATPAAPSVDVYFNDVPALKTMVISPTRLIVKIPPSPLPVVKPTHGEGAVDVRVRNLDDDGLPIGGEEVTSVGGLTYQRVQLATWSDLVRLMRVVVEMMRREIAPRVVLTVHTEYDSDTTSLIHVPDLGGFPGLGVVGPSLVRNYFYESHEDDWQELPSGELQTRRGPFTFDLIFSFVGVSDLKIEEVNFMVVVTQFFERNKYVEMQRDPTDASKGNVRYELSLSPDGDPTEIGRASESNIRAFSGSFVIRGFDLEGVAGFDNDQLDKQSARVDDDGIDMSYFQAPPDL